MAGATVIICEFNPIHRGHLTVLGRAASYKKPVICVMSGNFTQRSESAVFDKYKRAAAAIECGADLVLELPFPWSCSVGEYFAFGGVAVGSGVCGDRFVFGSEMGDTDYIRCAADLQSRPEYINYILNETSQNMGAAASHAEAMEHFGFKLGPNDKLGVEYMKAADRLRVHADFTAVKRMTDPGVYRSATELRRLIFGSETDTAANFIPPRALSVYGTEPDVIPDRLAELEYLFYRLFRDRGGSDGVSYEGTGGVSERLSIAAKEAVNHREFFSLAATKRFTNSRLRRAALFELLGVDRDALSQRPRYTVLLGANKRGREYLADNKKRFTLSVLTKPSAGGELSEVGAVQYELAKRADELYAACMKKESPSGEFLRRSPYIK